MDYGAEQSTRSIFRDDEEFETLIVVPPDGGWGWVVVVSAFISNMIADGISYTFGLFLDDLSKAFGVTVGRVTIVGSVMSGFYYLIGPFVSALVNRYGFRLVVISGGILAATGFGLGSITYNLPFFVFASGGLTGVGLGMITMPAVIVVGFYFEKWRALATGIATCGSGIGTLLTPPFITFLMQRMDWRNTYRVLACLVFFAGLLSILYRPLQPVKVLQPETEIKIIQPDSVTTMDVRTTKCWWCNCRRHHNILYPTTADVVPIDETVLVDMSERGEISTLASDSFISEGISGSQDYNPRALSRLSTPGSSRCPKCYDRFLNIITCGHHHTVSRPMYRDDIFFGHSLHLLSQYKRTLLQSRAVIQPKTLDVASTSGYIMKSPTTGYHMSVTRVTTFREIYGGQGTCSCSLPILRTLSTMLDFRLLKSYAFQIFSLSGFFIVLGYMVPYFYIKDRAIDGGIHPDTAYWLLSAIGAANTSGRIISGILPSVTNVKVIEYSYVCIAIGGFSTIVSGFYMGVWFQFLYACTYGMAGSCIATLRPVIVVELFGLEHLTNAFGLQLMFMGLAAIIGTVVAGVIYDITDNYNAAFYMAGICLIISAVMLAFIRQIRTYERRTSRLGSI